MLQRQSAALHAKPISSWCSVRARYRIAELAGKPMGRRVVGAAIATAASPVIVGTGNDADRVEAALTGCAVRLVNNPEFATGLSSSLKCGLKSLPEDCDGAVVLLGDM